jgi:nucleoid-associated protein YgaU
MLGFLKGQQGAWVLAAACAAGGVVGALHVYSPTWLPSAPFAPRATIARPAQPAPPNSAEAASADPLSSMTAQPASAASTGALSAVAQSPSSGADDGASKANSASTTVLTQRPEFDIVRIQPSGESVIAGRGVPGTTIALVDGPAALARAVADARGEVVFLPPPLAPGEHVLMLQSVQADAWPTLSSKTVTIVVPKASKDGPFVTLTAPDKPTADSGAPKPTGTPVAAVPAKTAPAVAIRTAEAENGGSFFATGVAPPGSQSRLYLNGAFLTKVIADLNGLWALKVEKGMRPGSYVVRADEVEPESGKVIARAEVPFVFPVPSAAATPSDRPMETSAPEPSVDQPQIGAPVSPDGVTTAASASISTIVKEVRTATVVRGDTLWRISRKMLGHGIRYIQIYEANESQIRNPRLVFPGQIFVMPSNPG